MNQDYDHARRLLSKYGEFLSGFVMVSEENTKTVCFISLP